MNVNQLKEQLDNLKISSDEYSLDGQLKPMTIALTFSQSKWLLFHYDERGHMLNCEKFETENEACENMLKRLISDKKFRKKFNLR